MVSGPRRPGHWGRGVGGGARCASRLKTGPRKGRRGPKNGRASGWRLWGRLCGPGRDLTLTTCKMRVRKGTGRLGRWEWGDWGWEGDAAGRRPRVCCRFPTQARSRSPRGPCPACPALHPPLAQGPVRILGDKHLRRVWGWWRGGGRGQGEGGGGKSRPVSTAVCNTLAGPHLSVPLHAHSRSLCNTRPQAPANCVHLRNSISRRYPQGGPQP